MDAEASTGTDFSVRPVRSADLAWVEGLIQAEWGGDIIVVHETIFRPSELQGFVAERNGERIALVTYCLQADSCEIVTLNSLV